MKKNNNILLGVNIDHVATLRQQRHTIYPEPVEAVVAAERAGADGITVHLREDRRHIQELDIELISRMLTTRLNLEMAVTDEMIAYAEKMQPAHICFVPEKREELTTEGGLDVVGNEARVQKAVQRLQDKGMEVSLFIDPDEDQIAAALRVGAPVIEIHTGAYADAQTDEQVEAELQRIIQSVKFAANAGLIVNAGHGLNVDNVRAIAQLSEINELNIGHSIVARAIFIGFEAAVREMKTLMVTARNAA